MHGDIKAAARPRVLIVEDEAMVVMMLEDLLDQHGYDVAAAAPTVEAAAAVAGEAALDLAILDVNVRGEMTFPVADLLVRRGVPFIISSGYGAEALPPRFRDAPFLGKPIDPRALAAALKTTRIISDAS